MTDPSSSTRYEEDCIPGRRIVRISVSTLVIGALAVFFPMLFDRPARPATDAHSAPPTLGMAEQNLFDERPRATSLEAAQRAHLQSYGWLDHDAGLAFVPIDRAIDLVAGGGH